LFAAFESLIPVNFIVGLKQEQSSIRRGLARIETIRETNFIASGYIVTGVTTVLLVVGMVLAKVDPFEESLFFTGVTTFVLVFLNLLIRDLDNPFGYYEKDSAEDVSLKPLDDLIENLRARSLAT
jgi:hypothetical protein